MGMELALDGGGRMRVWEDSGRVFFRCERAMSRDGLYKVWIRGNGGEMLLGTLVPEGEQLALGRVLWPQELHQCGCWPVRGGACRMAFPFGGQNGDGWRREEYPQTCVREEIASMEEWCPMLRWDGGEGIELAWPLKGDRPVPLTGLICLAQPRRIRGELCLVWRFDREGHPRLPGDRSR